MQSVQTIRDRLKRKLSLHDKNPNLDEAEDADDVDDETAGNLQREVNNASDDQPYGRPGSFLNKLILYGNKKTEDEIARDSKLAKEAQGPSTSSSS